MIHMVIFIAIPLRFPIAYMLSKWYWRTYTFCNPYSFARFQLWTNGTYLLMSITVKFDRDLTTRNVYLCMYEPRKPSDGLGSSLWSVISGSGEDGRWVNQGDSVVIRSDDLQRSADSSSESLLSRWATSTPDREHTITVLIHCPECITVGFVLFCVLVFFFFQLYTDEKLISIFNITFSLSTVNNNIYYYVLCYLASRNNTP